MAVNVDRTPDVETRSLCAAMALAAHYFPTTVGVESGATFESAAFFLTGQYRSWSRWPDMSPQERARVASVFRMAPADLASPLAFSRAARSFLAESANNAPTLFDVVRDGGRQIVIPRVGGDLLSFVDRQLKKPVVRKPLPFAGPGSWTVPEQYFEDQGKVSGIVSIPSYPGNSDMPGHDQLPSFTTVPPLADLTIPSDALLTLARQIDQRLTEPYLHRILTDLLAETETSDEISPSEALRLGSGGLQIFNAPTGTGKSVLVRVMASWFALNNLRVAIVLPDIPACIKLTWEIRDDFKHLRETGVLERDATCAHLMSDSGIHDRVVKNARLVKEDPAEPGIWDRAEQRSLDDLAYGCALRPLMQTEHGTYPHGQEPCTRLVRGEGKSHMCPWVRVCGKFKPAYESATADVVVLNHFMFMQGKVKIGVNLDGHAINGPSAAELVLKTSHAVLVDEVDQFQSRAVEKCTSELTLHSRRPWTAAPQEIDADSKRLPVSDERNLLYGINHVRLMAESLLLNISSGRLSLEDVEATDLRHLGARTSTRWHRSRGRDKAIVRALWPDETVVDGEQLPEEVYTRLAALMPAPRGVARVPVDDPRLVDIPSLLGHIVAPRGEDHVSEIKLELHDVLSDVVPDVTSRTEVINDLVLRAMMLELDHALSGLRGRAHGYRSLGLRSAQRIAANLQPSTVTEIFPYGTIGRSITGYRVGGLDDVEKNATLSAQNIGGDPHAFTAELGGLVSLVLADVERPVMGFSATAYFPQAVREHVHADVCWWMTDARARSIVARQRRVDYGAEHDLFGDPIRISGLPANHKRPALIELGSRLYDTHIHQELQKQLRKDPTRAHVLVVANSYDQCAHLATGISRAADFQGGLCVAVRDEDLTSTSTDLPEPRVATRLTREQFEEFPKHGRILVVPLQLIARGLNIVIGTRSAVRAIYLCVRPLALLTEPAEMYGSINAAGLNALLASQEPDPARALAEAREAAGDRLSLLLRAAPQFASMPHVLQEEVIAGVLVDLIQLAGRARRGGTDAVLHMVDYAFQEDAWSADLNTIIRRIHSKWSPDERQQMNRMYGEALNAFLSYAGISPELSPAR
ncbi:hypothetical protein L1785_18795 [Antribacter sp. KLBMP9083]|uniref:Helicase ATP-binding domain-containing protein n=1 Tax=Antribacter soli TaxID=2910976 RepID=A0AA41U8I0_9MICO|nr:hypothetical protein [Antribacter soli]MCF4123028.1 hypothetical protein [Antribacter soli]